VGAGRLRGPRGPLTNTRKRYERADSFREPIENLDHFLHLIQECWDTNHPAEPTPQIIFHYINASWEPIAVSSTPSTANHCPDNFWESYDDEEYDYSSSGQEYFSTDDDSLLCHTDESGEDSEDFGMFDDFSE